MAIENVLTLHASETLKSSRALLERARRVASSGSVVVVDCAALVEADCAGLQVLLALRNALGARGGVMQVINVPDKLAWRFDFVGLVYSTG